ncbi:MAG: carboxypeptidase regulatory-like domain-containing protein [Bacteroidales bacterium]|nr:carboxypeptidase regulatory-like domain-containing protein [Bacteroidales bacterium]
MKRTLTHIFILLLTAAAASSCSVAMDFEDGMASKPLRDRQILISGQVMDASGNILKDITIDFNAYVLDNTGGSTVSSETVHTDSKGLFSINSEGAQEALLCTVTASDKKGMYDSQTKQIIVTWDGPSFQDNLFVVNDCNFHLNKKGN